MRSAEEDGAVGGGVVAFEEADPDRADQVADVEEVSPVGALDGVDGGAESGGYETDTFTKTFSLKVRLSSVGLG